MTRLAATPFPWREVMSFGLGRLGWEPDAFWRATPREIAAALRVHRSPRRSAALERIAFEALMQAHPDRR